MTGANTIVILLIVGCVVLLVIWEISCHRRRKGWIKAEGRYLGLEREEIGKGNGDHPLIEYHFRGEKVRQLCYEGTMFSPKWGAVIPILIDPETGKIVMNSRGARWSVRIILFGGIVTFSLVWVSIVKEADRAHDSHKAQKSTDRSLPVGADRRGILPYFVS
jgi:hypothetical protein